MELLGGTQKDYPAVLGALPNLEQGLCRGTGPHNGEISVSQYLASWVSGEEVDIWDYPCWLTCALPAVTEAHFLCFRPL